MVYSVDLLAFVKFVDRAMGGEEAPPGISCASRHEKIKLQGQVGVPKSLIIPRIKDTSRETGGPCGELLFRQERKPLIMVDQPQSQKYRSFVADGIEKGRREELVGGGLKRHLKLSGGGGWQAYDERVLGSGEFVEHLWQEIEKSDHAERPGDLNDLIGQVAAALGIEAATLYGRSKRKKIADARAVVCYWAIRITGCTTVEVAEKMGVTRSAVVHASARGEKILNACPVFRVS